MGSDSPGSFQLQAACVGNGLSFMVEHATCNCAAYWQPFAIAIGMLWAVNTNCVFVS